MNSDPPDPEIPVGPNSPSAAGAADGFLLSALEARILGALIEKEKTTPDLYPLSLNSLVNACNQTSNRDPVVHYDERVVQHGLDELRQKKLATEIWASGGRVHKFRHTMPDRYRLDEAQMALICVLLLRGAQTTGELRTRTERLHTFSSLDEVQTCLDSLMDFASPLARVIPPGHGQKEKRYVQLLSAPPDVAPVTAERKETILVDASRMESLEAEIRDLKDRMDRLREEFAQFRKQFE
ncbi:MAG TPA: YceH family protein [Terriglobia bacterium]|nr:YceH family protein [Terriglobia bacterium]